MELGGKHIVLGVTGGIACYKAAELVRLLVTGGATVQVVMTEAAEQFIGPLTFQALTGRPVYTSRWDARPANGMPHIDLTRNAEVTADAIVIAPASADFLSKLVYGSADDLLSTLCLARDCPLLVAPAMNRQMWWNPATQRNIAQLRTDGIEVLNPGSGFQACGEIGAGRMLEAEEIYDALNAYFQPKLLAGKRVLLTAGPTFEPIDPVRGFTNRSSGKMGFALARAAAEAGAQVQLVAGPCALPTPLGVARTDVLTALQMRDAVLAEALGCDIFIAVAAVADWRVAEYRVDKIKKDRSGTPPMLSMVENPDILAEIAHLPDPPYCVGFAAESGELLVRAEEKRIAKKVPLLIGNIGPDTFGRDDNEVILFDEHGTTRLPRTDKLLLARTLIAEIARRTAGVSLF